MLANIAAFFERIHFPANFFPEYNKLFDNLLKSSTK